MTINISERIENLEATLTEWDEMDDEAGGETLSEPSPYLNRYNDAIDELTILQALVAGERVKRIFVNGEIVRVSADAISYEAIATLAYPSFTQTELQNAAPTITYKRGKADDSEGILYRGKTVGIKEDMVFSTAFTGNA